MTHTQRWHAHHHTAGTGPLYQGRFKSFPIQADQHLLTVLRYVERKALRAKLVARAEAWRWSSLWQRLHGGSGVLSAWPVPEPAGWVEHVNQPQSEAELTAIRQAVTRGAPFGEQGWQRQTAALLGLESTLRSRGRPRKSTLRQA